MEQEDRSEQACPVCGQHTVALDEPPRIDVMGVQDFSDIVGMGDLKPGGGAMSIVCLSCGTRWADKAAFDRNEPEPTTDVELPEDADPGAEFTGDPTGGDDGDA